MPGSPKVRVRRGEKGGRDSKRRRKEEVLKGTRYRPRRQSLEELRSVSAPCLPVGGWGFFFSFPFIHAPFFPPPPLKQASRSVNVLRALGRVKAVGF